MRLRRISEELEQEYRKRIWILRGFNLLCLIIGIILYLYLFKTENPINEFMYGYYALLCALLTSLKRRLSLYRFKMRTFNLVKKHPYIIVNQTGVTLDSDNNGKYLDKVFLWDQLIKIDGKKIELDIGILTSKPKKYNFAFISEKEKRTIPKFMTKQYSNPNQYLKAFKKAEKEKNPELTKFLNTPPDGFFVELYDEMLTEIRKYWEKDENE